MQTGEPPFVTNDVIRARAHELWEQAGCPHGRDEDFWIEAEGQLLREWANREYTESEPAP